MYTPDIKKGKLVNSTISRSRRESDRNANRSQSSAEGSNYESRTLDLALAPTILERCSYTDVHHTSHQRVFFIEIRERCHRSYVRMIFNNIDRELETQNFSPANPTDELISPIRRTIWLANSDRFPIRRIGSYQTGVGVGDSVYVLPTWIGFLHTYVCSQSYTRLSHSPNSQWPAGLAGKAIRRPFSYKLLHHPWKNNATCIISNNEKALSVLGYRYLKLKYRKHLKYTTSKINAGIN